VFKRKETPAVCRNTGAGVFFINRLKSKWEGKRMQNETAKENLLRQIREYRPYNEQEERDRAILLKWMESGCDILKENDRYYMFYIGYQNVDTARVCMAESNDGIHNWVRSMDNPVISPEKKSWDADAVYKPTVVLNKQKNKRAAGESRLRVFSCGKLTRCMAGLHTLLRMDATSVTRTASSETATLRHTGWSA